MDGGDVGDSYNPIDALIVGLKVLRLDSCLGVLVLYGGFDVPKEEVP